MESSTHNPLAINSRNQPSQNNNTKTDHLLWHSLDGFKIINKLVIGSLLGGESFAEVYTYIGDTTDPKNKDNFRNISIESKNSKPNTRYQARIPTLSGVT